MSTSSSTVVGGDYNEEKDQQLEEDQQRQWLLDTIATTRGLNNNNIDLSLLIKLDLPNCGIKTLPSCLPNICPNLSILFLSKNNFLEVPAVIGQCLKLQMISFKECYTIESIHPESLQKQLRWLILTGNKIKFIPSTISRCTKLQKLMLSGNLLECLPEQSMLKLHNLELIRLACNQLTDPPIILLQNLQNLKWWYVYIYIYIYIYIIACRRSLRRT
jgi:Leucine-rich repeat (LRR) protein